MYLTINSHLERPFGPLIDQIATKVTCCTAPRCGLNTLAPLVGSGSAGKGKGRAHASSHSSGGEDEIIDLEESDLGSGVEDGDVEMQ